MNTSISRLALIAGIALVSSHASAQMAQGAMVNPQMMQQTQMMPQQQMPQAQNPMMMNPQQQAAGYNVPAYNNGYQTAPNYNAAGASLASPQMANASGMGPVGEVNGMNASTNEICRCIAENGTSVSASSPCGRLVGGASDRSDRDTGRRHGG